MLKAIVNGHVVSVGQGATLLDAIRVAKVHVPTLCYHPLFKPRAVCRMCLVRVEGQSKLLPACYTYLKDGDVITTDSKELKAFRKADLQLLLSRHPNECMRCEVSGSCKLQDLVNELEVADRWPKSTRSYWDRCGRYTHSLQDHTSPALSIDRDKCIECGLCVDACGPQGQNLHVLGFVDRGSGMLPVPSFDKPLRDTGCISCGQCSLRCPVGAITERNDWHRVLEVLHDRRKTAIVQTSPASRIAIGEEFGMQPGTISTGRLVNALRELGFQYVFDTNFAADLTIMEEASELIHRLQGKRRGRLPLFTSCCPAWVNYLEKHRPDLLPHLSTAKSPQQMLGAVVKHGPFLEQMGTADPFVVAVMPCTAKKEEAVRPGVLGDVDAVITTRELARMIKRMKIPFATLPNDGTYDNPLGQSSGAAQIFAASGGVLEAALRTASHTLGLKSPIEFHQLRATDAGVRVADVEGVGKVAAISGIASAIKLLSDANQPWRDYVMIEVMACVGGCLGGGGEPKSDDANILKLRSASVYRIDQNATRRCSFENPQVQELYEKYLEEPLSEKSEHLLHTVFAARHSKRELLARFLDAVDRRDGAAAANLFHEGTTAEADTQGLAVWDTSTEAYGVLKGRDQIKKFIEEILPPPTNMKLAFEGSRETSKSHVKELPPANTKGPTACASTARSQEEPANCSSSPPLATAQLANTREPSTAPSTNMGPTTPSGRSTREEATPQAEPCQTNEGGTQALPHENETGAVVEEQTELPLAEQSESFVVLPLRHKFCDPAEGLDVLTPAGDVVSFEIHVSSSSGLMTSLKRISKSKCL